MRQNEPVKLIAKTVEIAGWGGFYPQLIAMQNGVVSDAISSTLLDFITGMDRAGDAEFDAILAEVEAGEYKPNDPAHADYYWNAIYVWVRPPEAEAGSLLISNEYMPEYSMEDGQPQAFSLEFYRAARQLWYDYLHLVRGRAKGGYSDAILEIDWGAE
jgi:hypothetical protein